MIAPFTLNRLLQPVNFKSLKPPYTCKLSNRDALSQDDQKNGEPAIGRRKNLALRLELEAACHLA